MSFPDKLSIAAVEEKLALSKRTSQKLALSRRPSPRPVTSTLRLSNAGGRKPSKTPSKLILGVGAETTTAVRRDQLRIYENGEDVTPRNLTHHSYQYLDERYSGLEPIRGFLDSQVEMMPRASGVSQSTISTLNKSDESIPGRDIRKGSSVRGSLKIGSERIFCATGTDTTFTDDYCDEAPSQFPLPKFDDRDFTSLEDRIVLTLKETDTISVFELPQQTELADTEEGKAVAEENERYKGIMGGMGRKTVNAEVQTPQFYTKTRGTYIGRKDRKNSSTYVNNWVMYDSYLLGKDNAAGDSVAVDRFKFPRLEKDSDKHGDPESENDKRLEALVQLGGYEDATRVTMRILAGKQFETAQKRFAGMIRQDPRDPNLQLTYQLDLLWTHTNPGLLQRRPVAAFKWNPVNDSLLAVSYGADPKAPKGTPRGLLLIWCAKNPSEPDRCYEFSSQISSLDWSKTMPNLLAIGFYDGVIRIIDVSKRNLTLIRETQRKDTNSFGPYWQVQWWPLEQEPLHPQDFSEQLMSSNQEGRVASFSPSDDFIPRELLQVQRLEGKIAGVKRVNHCLGHDVPISRTAAALLLRQHPDKQTEYLVGTEEGCVLRCSSSNPHCYFAHFLAHDGPIYGLEFSPFHSGLLLTCGADWFTRIWAYDLIDEPLFSFGSGMACVNAAAWSPRISTIFATAVENEIFIWDLSRKGNRPASVTKVSSQQVRVMCLNFTRSGEQLVAADDHGTVYIYGLTGMPLPAFNPKKTLIEAVHKGLLIKPELLHRLKKIDSSFDF